MVWCVVCFAQRERERERERERKREREIGEERNKLHTFVLEGIPPVEDLGIELVLVLECLRLMQHPVDFFFR